MLVLEAANIKKYYNDRLIIGFDRLKIYSGEKIGIVGVNGSGKTTLLNILSGEIEPDEGFVRRYCGIDYIRQFSKEKIEADSRLLREFNLTEKSDQTIFSGGEYTRIKIANAFSNSSMLLFADEPTSNLDYKGVVLLKKKLATADTLLLICHDRSLLDELCSKIIEIKNGELITYGGNYTFYKYQSEAEYKRVRCEYEKYTDEKQSLEEAIENRQTRAKKMRKTPKRMGNSEARLHRRSSNEKQEKLNRTAGSIKTRLEKLEVKEKPKELPKIKFDFSMTEPPGNKIVISVENLDFSYGSKKIFNQAAFRIPNGSKTALWGDNGTGKSTLLNLIAACNPGDICPFDTSVKGDTRDFWKEAIHIVPKVRIGYFHQGFENLEPDKTVLENVMADSVQSQSVTRTILARLLITERDVGKKIGALSGGERIKASFAKLFVSKNNLLLLDESTNYLDMMSLEALEKVLCDYRGTVIFVSHDRAFVNNIADRLLVIENQAITEFEGGLEGFLKAGEKPVATALSEIEKAVIQMRITEILAVISRNEGASEELEAEYQRLTHILREDTIT